jgi:hypothetical protein
MQTYKLLVCGGRDYSDTARLTEVLDRVRLHLGAIELIIIHGGCPTGADAMADKWAEDRGVERIVFLADWKNQGRAAGPIRNQKMLDDGAPDGVIAFPGGRGTADMMKRATKLNLPRAEVKD